MVDFFFLCNQIIKKENLHRICGFSYVNICDVLVRFSKIYSYTSKLTSGKQFFFMWISNEQQ